METTVTLTQVLLAGAGTLITVLFAGNLFFIVRLVNKIDESNQQGLENTESIKHLSRLLESFKDVHREISELKIEVGVLKVQLKMRMEKDLQKGAVLTQ